MTPQLCFAFAGLARVCVMVVVPGLLLLLLAACNSSDNVPEQSAAELPLLFTDASPADATVPAISFDGSAVSLFTPESSLLKRLAIADADAESALEAGPIPEPDQPSGFTYSGNCRYGDSANTAANGRWYFELGEYCELIQKSSTRLTPGEGVTLVFNVLFDAQWPESQLHAQIVAAQDDGTLKVVGTRTLSMDPKQTGWNPAQVSVLYGDADGHSNETIGLRLINPNSRATVLVDHIELSVHQPGNTDTPIFNDTWRGQCNQLWAGQYFWSNRLQDWEVLDGRLRTRNASQFRPNRTTHRITTLVSAAPSDFTLRVDTGIADATHSGAYSGFLIGAGARMDYRSASLVHNRHGQHGGLIVGIDHEGRVFILDHGVAKGRIVNGQPSDGASIDGVTLQLDARVQSNGRYRLNVFALRPDGQQISSTQAEVDPEALLGNIALVSNPGSGDTTHWFDNWRGFGEKLQEQPSRQFGPVLFSSYTVSRGVLTLNAQYPPVCSPFIAAPELQINIDNTWHTVATASIDKDSYTARFQVNSWNYQQVMRYRIVTRLPSDLNGRARYYQGAIQPDIDNEEDFVLGVYNCRPGLIASDAEGWIQQNNDAAFSWTRERIVFPHEELLQNSQQHALSMVAFLGDQIYEFDPNGLIEKHPDLIINDYLWKWFQFGWSAREIMRNLPSLILPDDHDVYQANIWGQEGIAAEKPEDGGFVYPAPFNRIVRKTQTGSLPEPYSDRVLNQGIESYYTSVVYRGIGMAVLEDRTFKTGPNSTQRPLQLLGPEQQNFLEQWALDWQGQRMKLAVSQSPFSQSTTHSGQNFTLINRDLDSNGWPKQGRDDAVRTLRKALAPHVAGDQHLGMSLKHGVDLPADAVYSFAGPSMLNIFPRIWDPANTSDGPGNRNSVYLGDYTDQHGNFITVLAAANPDVYYKPIDSHGIPSKNDLGIGYGIVRIHKAQQQYTFEAWPANVSPNTNHSGMYPNWPITVDQLDNDGRLPVGYLPSRLAPVPEPVVQVFNEADGALIYARRLNSASVTLPVYDATLAYRVVLSDPDTAYQEEFRQQTIK